MARITFLLFDGTTRVIEMPPGGSVMSGAVAEAVPGIRATCGGSCVCATCHVYVDEAWRDTVGDPGTAESRTLRLIAAERRSNSRLSCQIRVTPALDGLILQVPDAGA